MSAIARQRPLTYKQRSALATQRLCELLGLQDTVAATSAAAEVLAEDVIWNKELAVRVRAAYEDLTRIKPKARQASSRADHSDTDFKPIHSVDPHRINPYGPLDPYVLYDGYGPQQLPNMLRTYGLERLKEAASVVQQRHPGTKPTNKSRKDSIIAYIVEHVAGPGY